ncbi:hypothetical protein C3J88_24580 [Klebsiella pneumoniae subsp. pneumoniae]|nr:hypothetical protein C3J88_24580 [Klebsiella pneumoniae subsp. pneumoniae]
MMSLWDALRMNMMISYQELVRTFPNYMRSGCNPFFPLLIIYPALAFCCFYQLFIKMNTVRLSLTRSPLPIIL